MHPISVQVHRRHPRLGTEPVMATTLHKESSRDLVYEMVDHMNARAAEQKTGWHYYTWEVEQVSLYVIYQKNFEIRDNGDELLFRLDEDPDIDQGESKLLKMRQIHEKMTKKYNPTGGEDNDQ